MVRLISRAAGAAAVMALSAGMASAAPVTFNFNVSNGLPAAGPLNFAGVGGPVSVDVTGVNVDGAGTATGNALIASYSGSEGGIGVCSGVASPLSTGGCAFDEHTVDSSGQFEMAQFSFGQDVTLTSVTFSLFGSDDDFDFAFYDGGTYFDDISVSGSGQTRTYTFSGSYTGTEFGIGASRACFIFCEGTDTFKIKSMVVDYTPVDEQPPAVPLPAAGFLLLGALGGLGALRARRSAA